MNELDLDSKVMHGLYGERRISSIEISERSKRIYTKFLKEKKTYFNVGISDLVVNAVQNNIELPEDDENWSYGKGLLERTTIRLEMDVHSSIKKFIKAKRQLDKSYTMSKYIDFLIEKFLKDNFII